jgi:hypothetical protein
MEVRKILGSSMPAANTNTQLYIVPAGKEAIVATLTCCNQDIATADPIRVAVCAGSSPASSEWIYYDYALQKNETLIISAIPIKENNTVFVFSKNGTSSFNAFGVEL